MMSDPSMMTDMLKKNLNMIVPQMLTAAWVNFFFTGFVVGKVPFPLTQRFRGMLQRGIELQSLDVTYISSLSWYFLNFFGLRGVFSLCLGANQLDDAQAMQQQMAMGMDTGKAFGVRRRSSRDRRMLFATRTRRLKEEKEPPRRRTTHATRRERRAVSTPRR